ncbi:MAG: hypothetical protein Q8S11_05530 [Daejeonella sp.]|uniref:hypothetical protein n=1 Tax=Daejeonella sp. TaxID=2805397 RepID=UPI002737371B|nr:hypothetical protein [Daejeonella sp.]MDP3467773.1 hypothetical protein [Daejeonella sp.]
MKKLIMSAAIALFAVSAFAQSNDKTKQGQQREYAKDKDKTDKGRTEHKYDVNNDGIFSPEERETRKADKMGRRADRKADRRDDGLLNGSNDKNMHGRDVSGTARGTMHEGREKGKAVSDVARSNGKSRERMQGVGNTNRPDGGRPAGAGRPGGAGRKNN